MGGAISPKCYHCVIWASVRYISMILVKPSQILGFKSYEHVPNYNSVSQWKQKLWLKTVVTVEPGTGSMFVFKYLWCGCKPVS